MKLLFDGQEHMAQQIATFKVGVSSQVTHKNKLFCDVCKNRAFHKQNQYSVEANIDCHFHEYDFV